MLLGAPIVASNDQHSVITEREFTRFAAACALRVKINKTIQREVLSAALAKHGLKLPAASPASVNTADGPRYMLNTQLKYVLSEFIRRTHMPLPDFVELVHGQTACDYRPNKNIVPSVLSALCRSYKHRDLLLRIAHEGVRVSLREQLPQTPVPDNHNSVRARLNVLRKNVRKEQDDGRCLVLDLDLISLWPEVRISPYGVVDKAGVDPSFNGRTIHDLSFPPDGSIKELTDQSSIIHPDYKHCHAITMEVLRLRRPFPDRKVYILAGDVAAAFRHIGIHSQSVHLFGAKIDEDNALVLDLACPLGWPGSPGFYEIFGGANAHVHGSTIPSADAISPEPFFRHY